jgi:drug/metabolite transporter (DMT)-like permease
MLTLARISLSVSVLLFFVALLSSAVVGDETFGLLVPAGLLVAMRGVAMLTDREGVLRPLAEAEAESSWTLGFRKEHPAGAVMAILVGLGWAAFGIAALLN